MDSQKAPAPVFLLSSPCSGSTFFYNHIRELLGSKVLTLPGDSKLVQLFVASGLQRDPEPWKQERALGKVLDAFFTHHQRLEAPPSKAELMESFRTEKANVPDMIRIIASSYHSARYGEAETGAVLFEKTPENIHFQQAIRSLFPHARFIFMVRDPREVIASLKNRTWSSHNPLANAKRWVNECRKIPEKAEFVVRYEDLVRDPHYYYPLVMRTIHPELSDPDPQDLPAPENEQSKTRTRKWKQELSTVDQELELVESICSEQMQRFGYSLEGGPKRKKFYASYFHYWLDDFICGTSRKAKKIP